MAWYNPIDWAKNVGRGIKEVGKKVGSITDESQSTKDQRRNLENQGGMSSWWADQGQQGAAAMGAEAGARRDYLRRVASGEQSISGEQLRQGLQQNLAAQRSMAAGASPGNAPMAARTAAIQAGRIGAGMSGQAAIAGMQERRDAEKQLADMILQQRQQDIQVGLGSRQNATAAYGGVTPEGSLVDKLAGPVAGVMPLLTKKWGEDGKAKSDERAKTEIKSGDEAANKALEGLRAYTFRYRDERDGKGKQTGVMAQDLEKAGLGHAVIDTPDGKYVHGGKLATSNAAMLAALAARVKRIEGGRR